MSTQSVPTSRDAYRDFLESGDAISLEQRVLALIAETPRTAHELEQEINDFSARAIQPRCNDLLRRGCVKRRGKRTNPSGNLAYVHHVTETGLQVLRGERELPEKDPTPRDYERKIIEIDKKIRHREGNLAKLRDVRDAAVDLLEGIERRMDPEGFE